MTQIPSVKFKSSDKTRGTQSELISHFAFLLVLGGVLICSLFFTGRSHSTAVEVAANPSEYTESSGGEPFGYFMGEWNLWEYIGDSLAYLLGAV